MTMDVSDWMLNKSIIKLVYLESIETHIQLKETIIAL